MSENKSVSTNRVLVINSVEFPVNDFKGIVEYASLAKSLDVIFPLDSKVEGFAECVQIVKTELIDKVNGNLATVLNFKGIRQDGNDTLGYDYEITLGELINLTKIKIKVRLISKKGKKAIDPIVKKNALADKFKKATPASATPTAKK
jgi:hypothetical protein